MKFWNFDDADSAIISLSSMSAFSCGVPYLVAPEKMKEIACEKSIVADPTVLRFMGHGLTTTGITCAACNNLSDSDKKDALKVLSAVHVSVAGMIAHATFKEETKNPFGIGNVLLHSGLAIACAARGFRKDDDDEEKK